MVLVVLVNTDICQDMGHAELEKRHETLRLAHTNPRRIHTGPWPDRRTDRPTSTQADRRADGQTADGLIDPTLVFGAPSSTKSQFTKRTLFYTICKLWDLEILLIHQVSPLQQPTRTEDSFLIQLISNSAHF
jgi:hypothetical protein